MSENRRRIDGLIRGVTPILQRRQVKLPDPAELRALTRLFVKYIRRGSLPISIRECARHPEAFAPDLADFVISHLEKGARHAVASNENKEA